MSGRNLHFTTRFASYNLCEANFCYILSTCCQLSYSVSYSALASTTIGLSLYVSTHIKGRGTNPTVQSLHRYREVNLIGLNNLTRRVFCGQEQNW